MTSAHLRVVTLPATTRYKKSVKTPTDTMFKSGANNKKLGGRVTKGMWKGMPLYSLTLEERKTCPQDCQQWNNCYGNNMPFAHRYDHTHKDFIYKAEQHLRRLAVNHESGFVVRLHVLGDFYTRAYVRAWRSWLEEIPQLRAYGYTHHKPWTPIGTSLRLLNLEYPDRWRIRFSDSSVSFSANVVKHDHESSFGIICPEQLGQAESCASCAYCWHSEKPVFFLEH